MFVAVTKHSYVSPLYIEGTVIGDVGPTTSTRITPRTHHTEAGGCVAVSWRAIVNPRGKGDGKLTGAWRYRVYGRGVRWRANYRRRCDRGRAIAKVLRPTRCPFTVGDRRQVGIDIEHVELKVTKVASKVRAGEGVVVKSILPNGRNAVWNNHAGEGVVVRKQDSPMVVTLFPIVTLVRALLSKAAPQWS